MIIEETRFDGLIKIINNNFVDERGIFKKVYSNKWNLEEFDVCLETNIVKNLLPGTVRGMHFQNKPFSETKLISVIQGRIIDFVIDLRTNKQTYGEIFHIELSSENNLQMLIPKGFAHGYQTLEENTIVIYSVDSSYEPSAEHGINPKSPQIMSLFPVPIQVISDKDLSWPLLDEFLQC